MSIENAVQAIGQWIAGYDSTAEGRDPNAFLGGAILIAASDGPVDDAERAQLIMLTSALGTAFDDATVEQEVNRTAEIGQQARIDEIAAAVPNQDERGLLVSFAALVGCAERGVNAHEGAALQKLGQGLGFTHNQVLELLGNAMNAAAGR